MLDSLLMNDVPKTPSPAKDPELEALQARARALLWFFSAAKSNPQLPQLVRDQLLDIPSHLLRDSKDRD